MHPIFECGCSRRPESIRPHTYLLLGRRRAGLRLFTESPIRVLLGNSYKIAVPSFYFTAVTVSRGTISVDGVRNFPNFSLIQEA